jgi:hypothetical protein
MSAAAEPRKSQDKRIRILPCGLGGLLTSPPTTKYEWHRVGAMLFFARLISDAHRRPRRTVGRSVMNAARVEGVFVPEVLLQVDRLPRRVDQVESAARLVLVSVEQSESRDPGPASPAARTVQTSDDLQYRL